MFKVDGIRPLAVCVIKHDGKLLSGSGHDSVKNETFYRLLGGGIEFGEKGEEALRREFREELGTEIQNIKYVTTLENIFTYEGGRGHEIVLVYEADLSDQNFYGKEEAPILDEKGAKAVWEKIEDFKSGKLILYPTGAKELL